MKFLKEEIILNKEQLIKWLKEKTNQLERKMDVRDYDKEITDYDIFKKEYITDTIENHLKRYREYLSNLYNKDLKEEFTKRKAIAYIKGNKAYEHLIGTIQFIQLEKEVKIIIDLVNLPPSQFLGFHIHDIGDCSNNFNNVGDHYNPEKEEHPNHKGDLPSIYSSNGQIHNEIETDKFTVNEIIGKSIIIHSQKDDFKSQPSGDSGDKIACGEIKEIKLNETN